MKNKLILSLIGSLMLTSCGSEGQQNAEQTADSATIQHESANQESTKPSSKAEHYAGLNWVDMSNPSDQGLFIAKHITVCKMPTESDSSLALEAYKTKGADEPFLKITGSMEQGVILASIGDGKTYQTTGPFTDDSEDEPFFYLSGKPADGSTADKPLNLIGSFKCAK